MQTFDDLFVAHPRAVGESYVEHGIFALGIAARLAQAAGAALTHALVPGLCKTTASQIILDMHAGIVARRAQAASGAAAGIANRSVPLSNNAFPDPAWF